MPSFSPLRISEHASLPEIVDLVAGLAVMVVVNWFALRPLFKPLERLADRMDDADVLRAGSRVPAGSPGEIGALEHAFNEMMERLESERRQAGTRALHAQEGERMRIARGLHDEVGQTMTGVLFQLQRLAREAPPEQREAFSATQQAVKASMDDVRRIAQGDDLAAIRKATEDLQRASHAMAEQLYKGSQGSQGSQDSEGSPSSQSANVKDAEVVDAEYSETR